MFTTKVKSITVRESVSTVPVSGVTSVQPSLVGTSLVFYHWAVGKAQFHCSG